MAGMKGAREIVFRPSTMGLWVSGLFLLPAFPAIVYSAAQFARGGDPMTNGITPREVGAFVGLMAFLSIFVIAGAAAVADYWFVRVVVGRERLRIFNMLNSCVFDAAWEHIQVYRRSPLRSERPSQARWHIQSHGVAATVPPVERLPQLHLAMLDRLPAGVATGVPRAEAAWTDVSGHVVCNLRDPAHGMRVGCSIVWYVGLALFAATTALDPAERQWGALTYLLAACGLVVLFGGPYPFMARSWRLWRRGSIEADRSRLVYDDGGGAVTIAWSDVRLVEQRTIEGDEQTADEVDRRRPGRGRPDRRLFPGVPRCGQHGIHLLP